MAVLCERKVVLGDLIPLGEIWVEVLLSVKFGGGVDGAVECQAGCEAPSDSSLGHGGQGAWVAKTHRTHMGVGFSTIDVGT